MGFLSDGLFLISNIKTNCANSCGRGAFRISFSPVSGWARCSSEACQGTFFSNRVSVGVCWLDSRRSVRRRQWGSLAIADGRGIWWVRPVFSVASTKVRSDRPTWCKRPSEKRFNTRKMVWADWPSSLTRTIFSPCAPVYLNRGSLTWKRSFGSLPTPSAR